MRLRNRDRFLLDTPYDCQTVLGTLRACTVTRQAGGGRGEVCFDGDIPFGGTEFALRPLCWGRNSWLPVLLCGIAPAETGSVVSVDARCPRLTRVFMAVWYGFLALFTPATLLEGLLNGFSLGMLAVPAMWAWGFGLSHLGFWRPMARAKRDLCRVLRGTARETLKATQ